MSHHDDDIHEDKVRADRDRGLDNQAHGIGKQIKGKYNEVVGAIQGDTSQEIKGKAQQGVGKAQENLGAAQDRHRARHEHDER